MCEPGRGPAARCGIFRRLAPLSEIAAHPCPYQGRHSKPPPPGRFFLELSNVRTGLKILRTGLVWRRTILGFDGLLVLRFRAKRVNLIQLLAAGEADEHFRQFRPDVYIPHAAQRTAQSPAIIQGGSDEDGTTIPQSNCAGDCAAGLHAGPGRAAASQKKARTSLQSHSRQER